MKRGPLIIVISIALIMLWGIVSSGNGTQSTQETKVVSDEKSAQEPAVSAIGSMYANMTGDTYDKAYLADMLAHHQGALNMASWARSETKKPELLTLSENILSTQTKEVQQMLEWQNKWGYVDGSDPHAGHAAEAGGTMGAQMAAMSDTLYNLTGEDYDKEFLKLMITHHQQAIDMSNYAETNAKHQEIKDLAKTIISVQQKEINDMKRWQQEWGY